MHGQQTAGVGRKGLILRAVERGGLTGGLCKSRARAIGVVTVFGREAVAEIIQSGLDITRAERELRAVVEGGSKREKMLSDFDELRKVIGGPGASDRFAARMVAELHATEAQ